MKKKLINIIGFLTGFIVIFLFIFINKGVIHGKQISIIKDNVNKESPNLIDEVNKNGINIRTWSNNQEIEKELKKLKNLQEEIKKKEKESINYYTSKKNMYDNLLLEKREELKKINLNTLKRREVLNKMNNYYENVIKIDMSNFKKLMIKKMDKNSYLRNMYNSKVGYIKDVYEIKNTKSGDEKMKVLQGLCNYVKWDYNSMRLKCVIEDVNNDIIRNLQKISFGI